MLGALTALTLFTAAAPTAHAWGAQGHQTVALVATAFLGPKASQFVQTTVDSKYNNSLAGCATWADTVRYLSTFKWSAPFHFLDAQDDPLNGSCDVSYSRDCPASGCVLSAISNYTQRVVDTNLGKTQNQQALYFITHFLGDIGQPLHVENYEVGGNDITATCGGKNTNLHATWDTGMPVTQLNALYNGDIQQWADALVQSIQSGDYSSQASSWISCSSTTQTKQSRDFLHEPVTMEREIKDLLSRASSDAPNVPQLQCPLIWAQEANAYDCSDVFTYNAGDDLCTGDYYANSIPIINLQIAKQGYRLAAWLNVIFDGSTLL